VGAKTDLWLLFDEEEAVIRIDS